MSTALSEYTLRDAPAPPRIARTPRLSAGPDIGTSVAVTLALWVSLVPSLLPRTSLAQGVVAGVLVALALTVRAVVRRLRPPKSREAPHRDEPELRLLAAAVTGASVAVAASGAHRWQNALREAMELPAIGPRYWLEVLAAATVVATLLVGIGHAACLVTRRTGWQRTVAVATVVCAAAVFGTGSVVLAPPASSAETIDTPAAPSNPGLSGSDGSLVDWIELGREGQRFVSIEATGSPVRTYVGLTAAPDTRSRAALAVREVDRAGGFDRAHLVVAVPTGSGWIDAGAVQGFEARWGDDVAIVAQQYADTPSWVTFVFDRDAAADSARALSAAVRDHLSSLPEHRRPEVHLYGQSLGALGARAAHPDAEPGSCGMLLAGPPAGTPLGGGTVLANTSDPVVWWRPALLWSPPDLSHARSDAPVPLWLPVASFLQTTVDLFTSLDSAPGHGHRYGPDQARCTPDGR